MKKVIFGINWAAVQNLYWFPVLAGALGLLIYAFYKRKRVASLLVSKEWADRLLLHFSERKLLIKTVLLSCASFFFFLALLQPQWGKRDQMVEQEGRELFIALDISRSMLAGDIKPDRLAFAKAKIKQLLHQLPSERVGLLVFSGAAVVQCPLTRDRSLFTLFLNQVDASTISGGTTALDQVIEKVVNVFEELPARKNKILVIFTDGEDFSRNLAQLKEKAQEIGLHIFTYGVGTEQGAPIPLIDNEGVATGYEKNEQGNVILSRLNEGILRSLSRETGAHYTSPTQSNDDIENLVAQVDHYEKETLEGKELSTHQDRYFYFLAVTFVCLLVEWLL